MPEFPNPMELVVLDPKRIRLLRDKPGSLLLKREENDPEPIRVKPSRNFPLTDPDHYISLLHEVDEKEEVEMGVIVEPKELESKSQRQLRRVLAKMYFLPVVLKISKITEEFGVLR
ncbi:MAG TPA: DUF1854 domain-containing protein, partial [Armatimonadota bacterium]